MSLVGRKAPLFKAPAVINAEEIVENFSLEQFLGKNEVVLFFYPRDFTFICPTEIIAFQQKLPEFKKRGVEIVGVSTDTEETHLAWLMTPQDRGGIEGVTYPLVADVSKTISMAYGVLGGEYLMNSMNQWEFRGTPVALRGTFLIDREGIVRHEYINDYSVGRNIEDTFRMVNAWQHFVKSGELCTADWAEEE